MIKFRSKLISCKLIYGIAISMAIIGILFITIKMFSKVRLLCTIEQRKGINSVEYSLASKVKTKGKTKSKTKTKAKAKIIKISSRSSTSIRLGKSDIAKQKESKEANATTKKKKDDNKKEKSTTKYISISQVKISRTMDLSKRTGLSRNDFIKLISSVRADTSGFFEDNAGKIYDLCEEYSINEIFFCGLISAESGWNIASNHRRTHNYISLMRNGKLIGYSSVNQGLEVAAQKLHYNYLTPGGKFYHGKTLAGVKTCFCPSGSWVNLVYGRMRQIL